MSGMTPTAEQRSDLAARIADDLCVDEFAPPAGPVRQTLASVRKKLTFAPRSSTAPLDSLAVLEAYGHHAEAAAAANDLLVIDSSWGLDYESVRWPMLTVLAFALRRGDSATADALAPVRDAYTPQPTVMSGKMMQMPFDDPELRGQSVDMTPAYFGGAVVDIQTLNVMWLYAKPKRLFGPTWNRERIEQQLEATVSQLHTLKGCQPGW